MNIRIELASFHKEALQKAYQEASKDLSFMRNAATDGTVALSHDLEGTSNWHTTALVVIVEEKIVGFLKFYHRCGVTRKHISEVVLISFVSAIQFPMIMTALGEVLKFMKENFGVCLISFSSIEGSVTYSLYEKLFKEDSGLVAKYFPMVKSGRYVGYFANAAINLKQEIKNQHFYELEL